MAKKPCDKWKEFYQELADELRVGIVEPRPAPELMQGMPSVPQLADAGAVDDLVKKLCACIKSTLADVIQAQTRTATARGLTTPTITPVALGAFTVVQIAPANPQRRMLSFLNGSSPVIVSPTSLFVDLQVGLIVENGRFPVVITEETWGAHVQSAWFGMSPGPPLNDLLVVEEVYAGSVGEKQLWNPTPAPMSNYADVPLIDPVPQELADAIKATKYDPKANQEHEIEWNQGHTDPQPSAPLSQARQSKLPLSQVQAERPSYSPRILPTSLSAPTTTSPVEEESSSLRANAR